MNLISLNLGRIRVDLTQIFKPESGVEHIDWHTKLTRIPERYTFQYNTMNEIKQSIVVYYESCINVIDNHAETLLSNPEISEREIQHVNSLRDLYISEIRRIERLNLENLKKHYQHDRKEDKIDIFDHQFNWSLQNKFCFFIPNDPNRGHLFKSNRFGVLVVLNQFIPVEIIENLM